MKTYSQLTPELQDAANKQALNEILTDILEGSLRFNDKLNKDTLQKRIDRACEKASQMRTPWFAHEYILDTCGDDLRGLASAQAEDALYLEPSEHAIYLHSLTVR